MATSPGDCRQTLMSHQASAFADPQSSRSADASGPSRLDATARQLRMALRCLSLPLASAARAFHRGQGWKEFGYARLSDHARERLDRSARWVRDLADFDEAIQRLPGLAAALTGEDGGRPIGLSAARHISKVAAPESLDVWLSMARTHSLGEFKGWVRRAAAAGSHWPVTATDPSTQDLPAEGDSHQRVCLFVPAAVGEAFAETLDLYRAVEGHTAPVGEFVDSLIAEASSGTLAGAVLLESPVDVPRGERPRAGVLSKTRGRGRANFQPGKDEAGALQKGETIQHGGADVTGSPEEDADLRARVRRWLPQVLGADLGNTEHTVSRPASAAGSRIMGQPSSASAAAVAVDADARMRRLLSLHDEIERQLAEVVTEMADTTAWSGLGYHGLDDYARRGLGWSRSTLYSRVQLVRRLRRLPEVGKAYKQGRIGRVAAQTLAHLLTRESPTGITPLRISTAIQKMWVERAAAATIKRLHDETQAVARLMVMGTGKCVPLADRDWHASLHRQAGSAQQRVQALTHMALAAPGPLLPLRLKLEPETATALHRVLAVARRDSGLVERLSSLQPADKVARSVEGAGYNGFQTVSVHRGAVPAWVALLALMQEFIATWDVDVGGRRPSTQRIYNRDGWRCMAPGCTSRKNLEVHHILYRSHNGSNRPENLACLCRFHHQMGEHGLLARVRGEAPLGLTWQMGRDGRGGQFRNELRLNG